MPLSVSREGRELNSTLDLYERYFSVKRVSDARELDRSNGAPFVLLAQNDPRARFAMLAFALHPDTCDGLRVDLLGFLFSTARGGLWREEFYDWLRTLLGSAEALAGHLESPEVLARLCLPPVLESGPVAAAPLEGEGAAAAPSGLSGEVTTPSD